MWYSCLKMYYCIPTQFDGPFSTKAHMIGIQKRSIPLNTKVIRRFKNVHWLTVNKEGNRDLHESLQIFSYMRIRVLVGIPRVWVLEGGIFYAHHEGDDHKLRLNYCWTLSTAQLLQKIFFFAEKDFFTQDLNLGHLKLHSTDLPLDQQPRREKLQ